MREITFFDDLFKVNLLPLTTLMPACKIRVGIETIEEKWVRRLNTQRTFYQTSTNLSSVYSPGDEKGDRLFINGRICPNEEWVSALLRLKPGQALYIGEIPLAVYGSDQNLALENGLVANTVNCEKIDVAGAGSILSEPYDVFLKNETELKADFERITKGRKSAKIAASNTVLGTEVFVEEGAVVECSVLNSESGPIYIGKDAVVMEGCMIRGGFAMNEKATLKMGAKIYGATTLGMHVKAGGEVNNSVIFDYSNKGHDGFLGNAVIGSWCNLGADTNNSNLKNNYGHVRCWSYKTERMENTGLQFCGLIMGDFSKTGINTMLNTGTVTGVAANIFGGGFPPKFVPDFSWGGAEGFAEYNLEKALEAADRMMERRQKKLTAAQCDILTGIFQQTRRLRTN